MNPVSPRLQAVSIVCGCYAIGFIAAPQLTPLVGPIYAILIAMSASSVLAMLATLAARRHVDRASRTRKP
ncbi:MAG: hypothetical protein JNG89_20665 [Planctomycetaceae bacterium]|nr:hypothetical protein [Planctomycetaceae bacterium]